MLVPPSLHVLGVSTVSPGDEVTVVGTGGHIEVNGGYVENARDFALTFDGQPIGTVSCFANSCEGSFVVPADASPGMHQIGVESGAPFSLTVE